MSGIRAHYANIICHGHSALKRSTDQAPWGEGYLLFSVKLQVWHGTVNIEQIVKMVLSLCVIKESQIRISDIVDYDQEKHLMYDKLFKKLSLTL